MELLAENDLYQLAAVDLDFDWIDESSLDD
jgi:hypothetical protein